jgi:N-carbamoylputrescine amidase
LHSKNDTMPNKKYKIAVIQLNLNDVAENNLKNVWVGCVMPQIKELKLSPYQNYIVAIISVREDVDNALQSRFTAPRLLLSVL